MTVYLFDESGALREALAQDEVVDLIHDVANYALDAILAGTVEAKTGEYIGFRCVDGRFRMFAIEECLYRDDKKTLELSATDRAVIELSESIIEEVQLLDATLKEALQTLMPEGWEIVGGDPEQREKSRAYFASAWTMCQTLGELYGWRIIPYYTFDAGGISGRRIAIEDGTPQWRGRVMRSNRDAANVCVTSSGRPITRLYGIGPATNSGEVQTNMTFADVEWETADGDPADKPKGQCWVEDADAVAEHGLHTAVVSITDLTGETDADKQADLLVKTWEQLQKAKAPAVRAEANIIDLEMLPNGEGVQHVDLGDLVGIRLDNGKWVEAKVISIKRNYARPWLSKITAGDKETTITTQVSNLIASATHTFERLTVYKNRFEADEYLIQLNAEYVQANAKRIDLFAGELGETNLRIDGAEKSIALKADKVTIDALETEIKGKVSIDELSVKTFEILDGLSADYLNGKDIDAGSLVGNTINGNFVSGDTVAGDEVRAGSLAVGGTDASWQSKQVVTGVKVTTATADVMSSAGKAMTIMYVSGVTPQYDTIKYLG